MTRGRTARRLHQAAWRVSALVLSGLVLLTTAGVSATASTADTRGASAETSGELTGTSALVALDAIPEAITKASPTSGPDLAPPPSRGADVDPLDLYPSLDTTSRADRAHLPPAERSAHPDRAPPIVGQF